MSWYVAPSLVKLRNEINAKWPKRDKRSDGSIGDAAHSARASDHNPNSRGSVNALDIDKDGINPKWLINLLISDRRVNYVIFNRAIWSRSRGFKPRRYTGPNPHDKHVHVSILQSRSAEQDTKSWFGAASKPVVSKPVVKKPASSAPKFPLRNSEYYSFEGYRKKVSSGVKSAQERLKSKGFYRGAVDGMFGRETQRAVEMFQKKNGLVADGLLGLKSWGKLFS